MDSRSRPSIIKLLGWLVILATFLGIAIKAHSQTYPVDVTTTLTPPYSVWLADYIQAGNNKLNVTINFKDFNEPSFDVRLRLKMTGPGITLQTKDSYIPSSPITLTPGVPTNLTGNDLTEYFTYNNLNFTGTTQQAFSQNGGKLPEGQYQFCIEVLDYVTGKPISREGCASAWIQLKDQPLVMAPVCGDPVLPGTNTNIIFQWQNSGSLSQNSAMSTEYELTILEVTVPNADPMNAIANQQVLQVFSSGFISQTTYVYSQSDPPLDLGKKYVWRIQARDSRGFDSFKNNGYSEPCWFSYGYPEGGIITLNEPEDDFHFTKNDIPHFKWSTPDNLLTGQQVEYTLKIVEMLGGQDAETAMGQNNPWLEETLGPTSATNGYEYIAQDSIPKTKEFAWYVEANTGEQVVAQSGIKTFTGPPLIEEFKAGEHDVIISELTSQDLTDLDGTGFIQIGEGDSGQVEVEFEDLEVKKLSGRYVLEDGEILYPISQMNPISLEAQHEDVPNGKFYPEEIRLNKQELSIKGYVEIPLPLATNSNDAPKFVSQSDWLNFDDYELRGSQISDETKNSFSLLDPLGFNILYNETSEIVISDNEFTLDLKGTLTLPSSVKNPEGNAVDFEFSEQDNFNYGTVRAITDAEILVLEGSTIFLDPSKAILDFSENESPGDFSGDKAWTGLYFTEGDLVIPQFFDETGQMFSPSEVKLSVERSNSYLITNHVNGTGLHVEIDIEKDDGLAVGINNFKGLVKSFDFKVEESATSSGEVIIETVLPFITDSKTYDAKVPIEESGFGKAYFIDEISETVVFDADDDQRRTELSVSNVTFDDDGLVDMVLDYNNPYTEVSVTGMSNFKMNAQGDVGFEEIGKEYILESPAEGHLSDIPIGVDTLAIARNGRTYGAGASASIDLGTMASGKDGELRTMLASAMIPEFSAGAQAEASAGFDAKTLSGSANAGAEASASAETDLYSIDNSAAAVAGVQMGDGTVSGKAYAGGEANLNSPIVENVSSAATYLTGGLLKEVPTSASVGAGAGGSAGMTEDGFKAEAYVVVDAVLLQLDGKVYFEYTDDFDGVFKGDLAATGKIVKIKNFRGGSAQVMLGKRGLQPIMLVRMNINFAVSILPPYLAVSHFGMAIGRNVSPKSFQPDNLESPTALEYKIDMSTPMSMYTMVGCTDGVVGFNGIVYQAEIGGGIRHQGGELDPMKPLSFLDLQLCGTFTQKASFINLSAGVLSFIFNDKAVLSGGISGDLCLGKVSEITGKGPVEVYIVPGFPICGSGEMYQNWRVNFGAFDDPEQFVNDFRMTVKAGSEQDMISVKPLCDDGLKALGMYSEVEYKGTKFKINGGVGMDIDRRWEIPKIDLIGDDYIQAYFDLKAKLMATMKAEGDVATTLQLTPDTRQELSLEANLYVSAGASYNIVLSSGTVDLGSVNLYVKGTVLADWGEKTMSIDGEYLADIDVLGTTYSVDGEGEISFSMLP